MQHGNKQSTMKHCVATVVCIVSWFAIGKSDDVCHLTQCICSNQYGENKVECSRLPSGKSLQFPQDIHAVIIENSDITIVEENHFAELRLLQYIVLKNCSTSRIHRYAFANATSLEELHFERTLISHLEKETFDGMANLLYLSLIENPLEELSREVLQKLPNLQTIFARNNEIKSLGDCHFCDNTKLQEVDLSNNKIINIPKNAFSKNNGLVVNLDFNNLTRFYADWFVNASITAANNSWHCDAWLINEFERIQSIQGSCLDDCFDPACYTPEIYAGRLLRNITIPNTRMQTGSNAWISQANILTIALLAIVTLSCSF